MRDAERRPMVRAAGGIVWRHTPSGGIEVLLVHRAGYDDWSFPKGKVVGDEGESAAALREVEEETGLRCRLEWPLGAVRYLDRGGLPKRVLYWTMEPEAGSLRPSSEVDRACWLPVWRARHRLTYERDRELLRRFLAWIVAPRG